MALNEQEILNWPFDDLPVQVSSQQAILYALGVGLGSDPLDPDHLRYVFEKEQQCFPTIPLVLGSPGMWFKDVGVNWKMLVHGEQELEIARPMLVDEKLTARNKVVELIDKGEGRGALLRTERRMLDAAGELVSRQVSTLFLRADGGFGGTAKDNPLPWALPDRAADHTVDIPTLPQTALIYRLSGDFNPLHADPEMATSVGFPRPILHGLCSYALAARAILSACCGNDPARFKGISARFAKPFYPGETMRIEIWDTPDGLLFTGKSVERDAVVLGNGRAKAS